MHYGARFYSPRLGRFVSADTIVPGAAASAGGGLATIGYTEQTRLTPLTAGFHETQFIGVLGAENRELLQFGPPALWDEQVRQEHNVPMGPANPQALNRYAYCFGNPLRHVDPTGHGGPQLDAIGWRLEGSLGFIGGGDINIDILLNIHEMQVELGPEGLKVSGCKVNISTAPGGQVWTEGFGVTTGPLLVFNLPENERLEGWGWRGGGTLLAESGLELEVFGSLEEHEGGSPVGVYIGFGLLGAEASAHLGGAKTIDIAGWPHEEEELPIE